MEDKNIQKKKKVLYGFGDSLVEGHCINIGMLDRLAEKNGMKYQKYARNGASVIPKIRDFIEGTSKVPDIATQIIEASDIEPDFICFDGLTNDALPFVAEHLLGSISEGYNGGFDNKTFYGALEQICFLLRKKYVNSRIFYIAVHRMPSRNEYVQEILHRAAREVCQKWSISHVDIYRYGQINTCIDEMRKKYSYDTAYCLTDGNGTHLNAQGYERWYLPEIEDAMRKYL